MFTKIILVSLLTLQTANTQVASTPGKSVPRFANLYTDNRAYRVDDIVTVLITESSSASEEAKTVTAKKNSITAGLSSLFSNSLSNSLSRSIKDVPGKFNESSSQGGSSSSDSSGKSSFDMSSDMSFDGSGTTSRKGSFTAQIAATVQEVLPNGNLVIEGKRTIMVNEEKKNITVSGTVRPEDIASDNSIRSSMIANAQIVYDGKGSVSSKSKEGLLMKLFNWIPIL